ncbi:uncharacterized protein CDAR_518331 [Caerostris darwini]|uniref:Ig-like domain-containing protein n=1 Tax=Caerostris darwini TaxID=1538125 RepID=A0AAV4VP80_9ARAC|nr:uncharacterized protein CDAR_518331 [Caerostris darwini]
MDTRFIFIFEKLSAEDPLSKVVKNQWYFRMQLVQKEIPPESSPLIYGEVTEYGDNLTVRCSSAKSKPAANLSWYVNDVLVR